MSIPAAFLDELRARTSLSSIIQRTTPLKKAGREWKACCPFHDEKSASFYVNDEKGFYHCFGCAAHGDVIRWMVDQNGLGFIDAVKELAAAAGMEVPAADPRSVEREKARDGFFPIMERAAAQFAAQLNYPSCAAQRKYLTDRGIGPDLIREFQIGFAPGTRFEDPPFLSAIGASADDLVALGLVKRNDDTGTAYDFFRRRIVIPIHDARGRLCGFGGRIVGDGEPKYLNSPDTPIFDKGRSLFNLHRAAPHARANNRLVIVEGYFDVISLHAVGMREVVAPNGTALTPAQMALAWKLVDSPFLCFDGDNAGRKAALRAALNALPGLEPGKGLTFVFPPDGQDPDDVARKGGLDAVAAMLADGMGIAELIWQDALAHLGDRSPESFSRVSRQLRNLVDSIADPDVRSAYGNDFYTRIQTFGDRQRALPGRRQAPARAAVGEAVQEALMAGVLRHPSVIARLPDEFARIRWSTEANERIADALIALFDENAGFAGNSVAEALEKRGVGDLAREASTRDVLRFPFLAERDEKAAMALLATAIRQEVSKKRR